MDHEKGLSARIRIYDGFSEDCPTFLPFVVAHCESSQNLVVLGPRALAERSDEFVGALYGHLDTIHLPGVAIRALLFHSQLCLAMVMPTSLKDEAGRQGLLVSVGFLVNKDAPVYDGEKLSTYMEFTIRAINRRFSIGLPSEGCDEFLERIRGRSEDAFARLDEVKDILLTTASFVGTLSSGALPPRLVHRFRRLSPHKMPKIILYEPGLSYGRLIRIYLSELEPALLSLSHTAVLGACPQDCASRDILSMLPIPDILKDANRLRLAKHSGKSYLCVYR